MTGIDLPVAHVHVWHAALPSDGWPAESHPGWAWLTDDERARARRFLVKHARTEFVAGRLLLRALLSRYEPSVPPETWRFAAGERGRPEIATPRPARPLRFNISHTTGACACAITVKRAVGVDIEWLGRPRSPLDRVDAFLSPREAEELASLSGQAHWDRFLEYWTLKESYIKARGEGLALPLDGFSMVFRADRPVTIAFAESIDDDPARWRFELTRLPEHRLAVAVERYDDAPVLSRYAIAALDPWLGLRPG